MDSSSANAHESTAARGRDAHDSDKDHGSGTARAAPLTSTVDGLRPMTDDPNLPDMGILPLGNGMDDLNSRTTTDETHVQSTALPHFTHLKAECTRRCPPATTRVAELR